MEYICGKSLVEDTGNKINYLERKRQQELLTLLERFFVGSMLLIFLFFSVVLCFVCLRYVSCVPNVASVGGLSISDCLSQKKKVQKDKQRSTKHTYKTKDLVTRTPPKNRG
jgi:hypothetical protein